MASGSYSLISNVSKFSENSQIKKSKSEKNKTKCIEHLITDWRKERSHLDLDFVDIPYHNPPSILLPSDSQETVILNDLLTCLMGRNGDFIVANPLPESYAARTFTINENINPKLITLAQQALELASHYSMVVRFIQDNTLINCGRVNQALSASMNDVVNQYLVSLLELEGPIAKGTINAGSFWHHLQPKFETLSFLSDLVSRIVKVNAKGGRTLSILHQTTTSNYRKPDSIPSVLALFFIRSSSIPYLESVQKWIFQGIIFDPYDEFMIVENSRIHLVHEDFSDEYWLKKYQIRKRFVPSFLEKVAEQILNSGKYLDAARHITTGDVTCYSAPEEELLYTSSGEDYLKSIKKAYTFSSKHLLDILIKDFNVIDRMKSVKRYFLLEQGDFITTVFDICQDELSKVISDIIPSKLSAFIEIALRIPSTNDDPYRDIVIFNLKPIGLVEQVVKILSINTDEEFECRGNENKEVLTGIDAFCLSVKYKWPVSLIFSKKVISCYQMLFRHLVYVKFVEMLLTKIWLRDMTFKKFAFKQSLYFRRCFVLRHKMIHFVQNMSDYMMNEAIEPNWFELMSEISDLESVDDLLKKHWNFLDNCMKDCLLTNPSLLRTFRDIVIVCKHFAEYMNSLNINEIEFNVKHDNIKQFESRFNDEFSKFLKLVSDFAIGDASNKMLCILYRFDINFFPVH